MPRRRDSVQRAVSAVVEHLEKRTLLTTIVGGGMDPLTGLPIVTSLTYRDNHDKIATIYVGGNTTVEAIFTDVNGFAAPLAGPAPGTNGSDLFHLYVAQADKNSFVAVTQIDPQTGNLIPFTADAGTFRVVNATTGQLVNINPNAGTGGLILGTRSQNTGVAQRENIPITSVRYSGPFGVRPDLGQRNIVAGFQVADGVDFGRFYFDGTITGAVIAGGSVEQMYAGNIFTGATQGTFLGGVGRRTPNFKINGDLHSLLVSGSIGTHTLSAGLTRPVYSTDFDGQVLGRIGGVTVRDTLLGGWDAINNPVTQPFGSEVEEVEGLNAFSANANDREVWALGYLAGIPGIRNDTFDTPQILPSYPGRKGRSGVVAHGTLESIAPVNDETDYYGMALLAGQSITVQLTPENGLGFVGTMNVGIFDPDGRLVATDYPNVNTGIASVGLPIRFTADRPGLYRIAVATNGNPEFQAGVIQQIGDSPYFLSISEAGNIGFGGISATSHVSDGHLSEAFGFFTENGDFGGVYSGGTIFSQSDLSMVVRKGHLRGIEGNAIGTAVAGTTFSVNLFVPRGTVGLVRSTGGNLALNEDFLALPIGGDYQVVSAAGTLLSNLIANRRIGVIRAANTATITPSVWTVNADDTGNDGIIDLIDVAGQFGSPGGGGPQITTNTEGNVRYMHVGYNPGAQVFRDVFFGSGQAITTYGPGERIGNINDDSGARLDFEPFPVTSNPAFVPGGTNPANIGPQIVLGTYGIRGSGGVAVFQVDVNGSIRIGVGGGRGRGSHAEIGAINNTGTGNPVFRSTASGTLVFANPTQPTPGNTNTGTLDVNFDGSGRVDVWQINGADFTGINNRTAGEIVNINSTINPTQVPGFPVNNGTIGTIQANSVGIATNYTGAALNPLGVIANNYPFVQQHIGVVSGNILNIQSRGGVGNLLVTGDIGNITANNNGKNNTGRFEGINAPVFATGRIDGVNIGEGILPSGSGDVSFSGLYALDQIGTVTNQGLGSDIRGDIYSATGIARVALHDGALIGAHIARYTQPDMMRNNAGGVIIPGLVVPINQPQFDIGSVEVGGVGGIIGTVIEAASIGPISVTRGFGILNSSFGNTADQRMESITAEGYGIRGSVIEGGAHITSVNATARGKNISVLNYTPSVRQSERTSIDPYFQAEPNAETDIHKFLGTTFRTPQVRGVTEPGMIGDTAIRMGNDVGSVFANTIVNSSVSAANNVGRIRTRGNINALSVTTGQLKSYLGGADASGLAFTVAGPINDFRQAGDISSNSVVRAIGGSGRITDFIVDGDLNGKVTSSNSWRQLAIGGDLGASGFVQSRLPIEIRTIKGNIFGTIKIG